MSNFFSVEFFVYGGLVILSLGLYAILWQKILSFMPLNMAYLFKSMTIVIILLISFFLFKEEITINNIVGTALILGGLGVLSWGA